MSGKTHYSQLAPIDTDYDLMRRHREGWTPADHAAHAREKLEKMRADNPGNARYQAAIRDAVALSLAAVEGYEAHRDAELGQAREEFQKELDRVRQRLTGATAEAEAAKAALEGRKPAMEVERLADGNKIRFPNPKNERGTLSRPWQVSELESLLYDLRLAGGSDWTGVEFTSSCAQAEVPYPEAVANGQGTFQYVSERKTEPTSVDLKQIEWQKQVTRLHRAAALGAWLAFLMGLILVLQKIF